MTRTNFATSRSQLRNVNTHTATANQMYASTAQIQSLALGANSPELLSATGACTLTDVVSYAETTTAGASIAITVPTPTINNTASNTLVGIVKIICMTSGADAVTIMAPGLVATLTNPQESCTLLWSLGDGWMLVSSPTVVPASVASVPVANSLFVSKDGNDTTALPYRFDLMYLTLRAANAAAAGGDTIYIYGGAYDESSLGSLQMTANVNYFGMQSAPQGAPIDTLDCAVTIVAHLIAPVTFGVAQSRSTICNIRLNGEDGGAAFTALSVVPFPSVQGLVFFVNSVVSESVNGGGGALIPVIDSLKPISMTNCKLVSTPGGLSPSTTPILGIRNTCVATLTDCSVSGFVIDFSASSTLIATDTTFDGFETQTLLSSLILTRCTMSSAQVAAPPTIILSPYTCVVTDCRFNDLVDVALLIPLDPAVNTLAFEGCQFVAGLTVDAVIVTDVSMQVSKCIISQSFASSAIWGPIKYIDNVFRDMLSFSVAHIPAGGGAYRFIDNVIEFSTGATPIAIAQTVESDLAATGVQSMRFTNNSIVYKDAVAAGGIAYTLAVADNNMGTEDLHVFTGNVFNWECANTVSSNMALKITSGGNQSQAGVGLNVAIVNAMTVD